jgi:WD40 repeat protein
MMKAKSVSFFPFFRVRILMLIYAVDKGVQSSSVSGVHSRTIYSVACNSEGMITTGSGDNAIRLFQTNQAANPILNPVVELVEELNNAHEGDVNHVCWHPSKTNLLVSCGDDSPIKLWTIDS